MIAADNIMPSLRIQKNSDSKVNKKQKKRKEKKTTYNNAYK